MDDYHWGFALLKHVIWVTPSILICQRFSPENSFFCSHLWAAFILFVIAAHATIYCTLRAIPTFLWYFLFLFSNPLSCFTLQANTTCDKFGFYHTEDYCHHIHFPIFCGTFVTIWVHMTPLFISLFSFFRFHFIPTFLLFSSLSVFVPTFYAPSFIVFLLSLLPIFARYFSIFSHNKTIPIIEFPYRV